MPQRSSIDSHPKRSEIRQALLDGQDSTRSIAAHFGVSATAVGRYRNGVLWPELVALQKRQLVRDERTVGERVNRIIARLEKIMNAADEQLQDPERPEKYDLSAVDAHRVVVRYERPRESDDKVVRERDTLQNLLDIVREGLPIDIVRVEVKHYDVLRALIESARAAAPQFRLFIDAWHAARTQVECEDQVDQALNWLVDELMKETEGDGDLRERIAGAIQRTLGRLKGAGARSVGPDAGRVS